ncbi:helix-turn-helix domain-containing protein [Microbacterium sp. NPDC091313]
MDSEAGRTLRRLRRARGLTQEQLSLKAGVSVRTLGALERGQGASPSPRTLAALLDALEVSASQRASVLAETRSEKGASARTDLAPYRLHDFTGREGELARAAAGAGEAATRVVVIAGPGGVGKTSLAVQAASAEPPDRPRFFVDLDGTSSRPLTVLEALRALIGQADGGHATPASVEAAVAVWTELSAQADGVVVILDSVPDADAVAEIVSATARGSVFVTTRRSGDGIEGATVVRLGVLPAAPARALLERIIPEDQRDEESLERLLDLTGRLPLALRIAGNRIAARPHESAARLADRLELEGRRLGTLVAGDLSVEAVFASSYGELPPRARAFFAALGVIEGTTFDAHIAAAASGSTPDGAAARLEELVHLALVESRGQGRYRLHDLVRIFARARLEEEFGAAAVARATDRLHRWLLGTVRSAGAWFEAARDPRAPQREGRSFADQTSARAWLMAEDGHWWPAYRASAARGRHEEVLDTADALHWFSDLWIEWGNWHDFFERSVAAAEALRDDRETARHLGYLSWTHLVERSEFDTAYEVANRALAAADTADDDEQRGWAQFYRQWALHWSGRLEEAAEASARSEVLLRAAGDQDGYFSAVHSTATIQRSLRDFAGAERTLLAALASVIHDRSIEDTATRARAQASVMDTLAAVQLTLGRPTDAWETASGMLEVARLHDFGMWQAIAMTRRAEALRDLGERGAALADAARARELLKDDPSAVGKRFFSEATAVFDEVRADQPSVSSHDAMSTP